MSKSKLFIVLGLFVLAYLAYTMFIKGQNPEKGVAAPSFEATTSKGASFSLEQYKGTYVILDFWASWCPPCRVALPKLIELQNRNTGTFEIVSIALEKDASRAELIATKLGINWPTQIVIEAPYVATNRIARKYGVTDIPATFLIDPNGLLLGEFSIEEIAKRVAE